MKKNLKIIFIVCLVLGVALAALDLFATSQRGHLAELEAQARRELELMKASGRNFFRR